jgi:hypothetical protein
MKSLKVELKKKEGSKIFNLEKIEQIITKLKIQVEEERMIEETLRNQL